jgi:hypothetical protein
MAAIHIFKLVTEYANLFHSIFHLPKFPSVGLAYQNLAKETSYAFHGNALTGANPTTVKLQRQPCKKLQRHE